MRLFFSLLSLFMLLLFPASAAVNKDIVTGAFKTPTQAQTRNLRLEAYLGHEPEISDWMKEKHFYFDVKYAKGLYRSVLTHFIDPGEMLTVYGSVKKIFPDAYVTASIASEIPKVGRKNPSPAKSVDKMPTAKTPQPKIPVKPAGTVKKEAPAPSAVRSFSEPVKAKSPAQNRPKPDAGDGDIVIIDETTEPEEAAIPAKETVTPDDQELEEKRPAVRTTAEKDGSTPWMIYGIAGTAVILIILLLLARRKKSELSVLKTPQMINLDHTSESETAPAPKKAEKKPEPEPTPEPEPVIKSQPMIEPEVAEAQSPVSHPAPDTEEAKRIESVSTSEEETPVSARSESPRKKRELTPHKGPITKESLADFAGNRILVAEDNLINQKVISKLLEGSGLEIVMANNGQEALDILAKDPNFNMVLMDAHMPVKDGFEATREIRRNILYEPIVVVALSGDVSSDDIRKMREAGMEEQLAKPLRVEALYDVMYRYLDFAGESEAPAEEEKEAKETETAQALDTSVGLDICSGDKQMYDEILGEFVDTYKEADLLVDAYLKNGDEIKLVELMLDIKGVASNIGAGPLAEAAETLREAVLINQTEAYGKLAEEFKHELHRLLNAIQTH